MYLELKISDGDGYISTFSDNAVSISCKQVSASEIQSLLQELSKNITLSVQENSDKTWFIVREWSQIKPEQAAAVETTNEQILKSFNESGKIHYQDKANVEFSRYKQDCRKRAIDIAVQLVGTSSTGQISNEIKREADIYYKWLIDIS